MHVLNAAAMRHRSCVPRGRVQPAAANLYCYSVLPLFLVCPDHSHAHFKVCWIVSWTTVRPSASLSCDECCIIIFVYSYPGHLFFCIFLIQKGTP